MELLHHHTVVLFDLVLINVATLILESVCVYVYLNVYLWPSHDELLVHRNLTDVPLWRSWAEQAFVVPNSSRVSLS